MPQPQSSSIFVDVTGSTTTLTIDDHTSDLNPDELRDYIQFARMAGETYLLDLLQNAEQAVAANTDFNDEVLEVK